MTYWRRKKHSHVKFSVIVFSTNAPRTLWITHVKPHFPNFKIKFSPLQFHFLCLPNDCLLRIVSRIDNQTNSMSLKDLEANAIDEEAIKKRESETYP